MAVAFAVAAVGMTPNMAQAASAQFQDTSPDDALRRGVTAYKNGRFDVAIPALRYAAERNLFLGQYYLARIFGDNDGGHTDHVKAYMLYQQIARDFVDVDPDDPRSAFVADTLVELAGYMRRGLPESGLRANRKRAAEYLNHAALYFNDEDAQFELAKLMLHEAESGMDGRARQGLDWLSVIAQRGHAGAQAFLADLLWRGKFTKSNPVRALALIAVASKNAPAKDTFWINDIFQNIYCGASEGVRSQATGLVADWDSRYGRKPLPPGSNRLGGLTATAIRTCADGKPVPNFKKPTLGVPEGNAIPPDNTGLRASKQPAEGSSGTQVFMRGGAAANGIPNGIRGVNSRQ